MRTFRYSLQCPQGMIFDTEKGMPDPLVPPDGTGWYDHPIGVTQDQLIEAVVKQELARQSSERHKLDKEHVKKFGFEPRAVEPDKHVEKALDDPKQKKRGKPPRTI